MSQKKVRSYKTDKGRVFVKENYAAVYVDGRHRGIVKVDWRGLERFAEQMVARDYKRSLSEPEWEVFV